MISLIGCIIGLLIVIYGLNLWKCRHLFEVDGHTPFICEWLLMSDEEQDKMIKEGNEYYKKEWENIRATMTDDEIEEKYCQLTVYANEELRAKRKIEEQSILNKRERENAV